MNKVKESVDYDIEKAKQLLIGALDEIEEKGASRKDIEQLRRIIIRLEVWQNR